MQQRDVALAVAEDDGVLEIVGGADQVAQRLALFGRVAAGAGEMLADGGGGGGRAGDFDLDRIVQELFGDPLDFRRHGGGEEQRLPGEGTSLQMRSMSGMNPMSSMRSASSITSSSTPLISRRPRSK